MAGLLLNEILEYKDATKAEGLIHILKALDKRMLDKSFDEVDVMLSDLRPEDLSLAAAVSVARFLYAGSYNLYNWDQYVSKVYLRMQKMDKDKDPKQVLRGLLK